MKPLLFKKPALLAGASGLVGAELVRQWPGPAPLYRLLRRSVDGQPAGGAPAPGLRVDFGALPALPPADAAFCCLGTTIRAAGSQAAFRTVDLDAVLAFAHAAKAAGVTRLAVVSALGADARSASFYNRVKGQTEDELRTLGLRSLVILRPSLLVGDRTALGQAPRRGERWALALGAPLAPLLPRAWRPIAARTVARAMLLALAAAAPGVQVLESGALQEFAE